jgi:hypothetical protein
MSFATALSYWSGLAFVAPDLPSAVVGGTTLAVHICDAVLCRLLAGSAGRPRNPWTVVGFIGGVWAVAWMLVVVLPRRQAPDAGRG